MENDINLFKKYLRYFKNDNRITVWHLSLMVGILHLSNGTDPKSAILISRSKLMQLSHMGSVSTYHKYLKELQVFGYINYNPSYHPGVRSQVMLCDITAFNERGNF